MAINGPDALWDFVGYVVLCAPDKFPARDYLSAEEQMNLERAFAAMRAAIDTLDTLDTDVVTPERRPILIARLDESLDAYRRGDDCNGAHRLQDFQDLIYKTDDQAPVLH